MRIAEHIYDKQKEYGYLKSIEIVRNIFGEESEPYNLKISLVSIPCWDIEDQFEIVFEGVHNLKIGDIDNLLNVVIQIEAIENFQNENQNYMVRECENELFSFTCKNILLEADS